MGFWDFFKLLLKAEFSTTPGLTNLACVASMIYIFQYRFDWVKTGLIEWQNTFPPDYMQQTFEQERYLSAWLLLGMMLAVAGSFFIVAYRDMKNESPKKRKKKKK